MDKQFYTVKEASVLLKITEQTLRNYINTGRILSERVFNSTVISKDEIERYIKEREGK